MKTKQILKDKSKRLVVKEEIKSIITLILIILTFIFVSYIVQKNLEFIKSNIQDNFFSIFLYILIIVVLVILAPINEVVLVPIASAIWGWFIAGLLTLTGWTIGSIIIFWLSRIYGVSLIQKLIPLNKIHKYEKFLPKTHMFINIILLRIVMPFDVISYAISLFTKINFCSYFLATIIGFILPAFLLAYAGTIPLYIQIIGIIVLFFLLILGFLSIRRKIKS